MPRKRAKKLPNLSVTITTLVSLLFLASAAINVYFLRSSTRSNYHKVLRVIDGDTVKLESGRVVRLAGINAPEKGFCGYSEAKKYLSDLVEGKTVESKYSSQGVYGRQLAYLYLDDLFINKDLLEKGLVRYEGRAINKQLGLMKANKLAKENKAGLYSLCVQDTPPDSKCRIKGNIDKSDPRIKIYSFEGCNNYTRTEVDLDTGEGWFCSEEEAVKAGFVKAKNCHDKVYKP